MKMLHKSILLYILVGAIVSNTGKGKECSRELSRKVNAFLKDDLFPRMKIASIDLPNDCPLNPALNMYKTQEESKIELNRGEWQCAMCGKRFISEFYLDRHFHKVHKDSIKADAVCLADFCEVIGCRTNQPNDYEGYSNKRKFGTLELCTEEDIVVHQQQCSDVSVKCFPSTEERQRFDKLLCKNLKCVNGILKGGLEAFSHDSAILYWILRLLGCVALFVVVCFHAMVSDTNIYSLFGFRKSASAKKDDYLTKFYSSKNSSIWYRVRSSCSGVYKRIKKEVLFLFKYKGKSN